jgi:hypothetical protein
MATMTGVVKSVGQMIEVLLSSGQRVFAPNKSGMFIGRKVDVFINPTHERTLELSEFCKVPALLVYHNAQVYDDDYCDFDALEPSYEEGWDAREGIIKVEWFEPDEVIVCYGVVGSPTDL